MNETEPVILPEHFGFCEGVKAADTLLRDVADIARDFKIDKIYGYHGIVHNDEVIKDHEENGVQFVDDLDEIPDNSVVVTSAHGVGPEVMSKLAEKGCCVFDATCPLVLHAQRAVEQAREKSEKVIYVCKGKPGSGKKIHDEVAGIIGHLDYTIKDGVLCDDPVERTYLELDDDITDEVLSDSSDGYRIVTETTLSADKSLRYREQIIRSVKERQPNATVTVSSAGEVCRAVTNRQDSVAELVELNPDRIVVVTGPHSSNGMSYVARAEELVAESGQATDVLRVANVKEAERLGRIIGLTGLTASASTPDSTIFGVAQAFGINQLPDISRKAFNLKDGGASAIKEKIDAHVKRLKELNAG